MKCLHPNNSLHLLMECGGKRWGTLLMLNCRTRSVTLKKPRVLLDTSNVCWTLTNAGKEDSCLYKIWNRDSPESPEPTTDVRVLDPVLISNITSNFSRLGEEVAVRVQFSGEESDVTWEVDEEPLPERYRLIDDNRTLIIPSVQRDDAKRRFRVRITNPVSEEIREYRLINEPMFIRMLEAEDPVLISNITSNCSRLGEEVAVRVQFSGEESAVTWEVDGEPIPERYRLIDDNRTLIIPSVQRDDAERRFRVRITNPVSEEIREYRLINDTMFIRMLETEDYKPDGRHRGVTAAILVVVALIIGIIYMIRPKCSRNRIPETQRDALYSSVPQHNGSVPAVPENEEPEAILIHNQPLPAVASSATFILTGDSVTYKSMYDTDGPVANRSSDSDTGRNERYILHCVQCEAVNFYTSDGQLENYN